MYFLNRSKKFWFNALVLTLLYAIVPTIAFSATVDDIIVDLGSIIKFLAPLIVGLALLYFFWGLATFILHAGDETKRLDGRQMMIRGLIALFVMVSVWGLVGILTSTFNIGVGGAAPVPKLPF